MRFTHLIGLITVAALSACGADAVDPQPPRGEPDAGDRANPDAGTDLDAGTPDGGDGDAGTPEIHVWDSLSAGESCHAAVRNGTVYYAGGPPFGLATSDSQYHDRPQLLATGAKAVSAGRAGIGCVLTDAGDVGCWGVNGSDLPQVLPIAISEVSQVAAGSNHACALRVDGSVWCWGENFLGQLGDGLLTARETPAPVIDLPPAVLVAAGQHNTCAVVDDGTVWCWGNNAFGRLGDGVAEHQSCVPDDCSPRPVQVLGLFDVSAIDASYHSCAVAAAQVWCWGINNHGQLGDGETHLVVEDIDHSPTPVLVLGIADAVRVSTGDFHTCAATSAGAVWCWGKNDFYALGDGTRTSAATPVQVIGMERAHELTAGGASTCALDEDRHAWCWGRGSRGAFGAGPDVVDYPTATPLGW